MATPQSMPFRTAERISASFEVGFGNPSKGADLTAGKPSATALDAIPRGAQVEKTPVFYLERDALLRFVGALEGPQSNGGVLTWLSSRNARIDASPRAGDAISLQIAHDPRWKAKVDRKEWPIRADGLGQMWIDPQLFLLCAVAWMLLLGSLTSFQFPFAPREKP